MLILLLLGIANAKRYVAMMETLGGISYVEVSGSTSSMGGPDPTPLQSFIKDLKRDLGIVVGGSSRALSLVQDRTLYDTLQHELPLLFLDLTESGFRYASTHPSILYLEEDSLVHGFKWGRTLPVNITYQGYKKTSSTALDRIDQRALPLDGSFSWKQCGSGVDIYILDSGMNSAHEEFSGRVVEGANFAPDLPIEDTTDTAGHGSCTASLAGGTKFGVAKCSTIIPVRVYDSSNSGPLSQVLLGMNYIIGLLRVRRRRGVINMSFGGQGSDIMDAGVRRIIEEGGVVAAAAGNDGGGDACLVSPARYPDVVSVGATKISDEIAPFSNIGPCVSLFAPGTQIPCAYNSGTQSVNVLSGTSMSTPLAAGSMALYLEQNPTATPSEVREGVICGATRGGVVNSPPGTTDLFLYTNPTGWVPSECGVSYSPPKHTTLMITGTATLMAATLTTAYSQYPQLGMFSDASTKVLGLSVFTLLVGATFRVFLMT